MALIIGGESVQGHLKDWSLPKLKLGDGGGNSDGDDHGDNGDGDDDDRCSPWKVKECIGDGIPNNQFTIKVPSFFHLEIILFSNVFSM